MATKDAPAPAPPSAGALGGGALIVIGLLALAVLAKMQATTGRGPW